MSQAEFENATFNEDKDDDKTIGLLIDALRDLKFGQVTAIVQDGVVVQIERIEKRRLKRKSKTV